jgi:CDP-paratose 2-epimerase
LGLVEVFRPGEYERVEAMLADLPALGIERLRTFVSWADHHVEGVEAWYDWLLPRLASAAELLPCVTYTPPSLGIEARSSSPPREAKWYADFLDCFVDRHGRHFEWVELWNEPNNLNDWDWLLDADWSRFGEMIGAAAYWMHERGKKTVLGGMCPLDANWLRLMAGRGVLDHIDAVGVHGFPGTWSSRWPGWDAVLDKAEAALQASGLTPALWITEVGHSTWNHREAEQVRTLQAATRSRAERVYWYAYQDLDPDVESQEGFHFDERHYHLGLRTWNGAPKLAHRALASAAEGSAAEGLADLERLLEAPAVRSARPRAVLIGGAGFVGINLADRLAQLRNGILVYDSLARPGVEENLDWLRRRHGSRIDVAIADVRDFYTLRDAVRRAESVHHFAAQVAVTTSLDDPAQDFEVNARGTLNLLEALRAQPSPPPLLFTSTNKVYGEVCTLADLEETPTRYLLRPSAGAQRPGFGEDQPLEFCSPYGCSKGVADQYVLDYARIFGLPAVVFRMSCIYGPHQFGNEEQGWVAHFLLSALRGQPITIYGNGKQVRDVLFVDDLVNAFLLAGQNMPALCGRAFNIGGGADNTLSLLELVRHIEQTWRVSIDLSFAPARPGDQPYYVSDCGRFETATGWRAEVHPEVGLMRLAQWCGSGRAPVPVLESSA